MGDGWWVMGDGIWVIGDEIMGAGEWLGTTAPGCVAGGGTPHSFGRPCFTNVGSTIVAHLGTLRHCGCRDKAVSSLSCYSAREHVETAATDGVVRWLFDGWPGVHEWGENAFSTSRGGVNMRS